VKLTVKLAAHALLTLAKGALLPVIVGALFWCLQYPIGYVSCNAYLHNKELSGHYSYFECYVRAPDGQVYTKQEYQQSVVGARLHMDNK
jgi:hypothetical protein